MDSFFIRTYKKIKFQIKEAIFFILPDFIRQKLKSRSGIQKMTVNFSWLFIEKGLRMVVGIFVYAWVARYLGPQKLGLWNYSIALVSMFAPIATLGVNNIVIRELVNKPNERNLLMGSTFILKFIGAIIVYILSLSTVLIIRNDSLLVKVVVSIIALGPIFQSFDVIDLYFQSQLNSKYSVIARVTAFLLVSSINVFQIIFDAPLIYFVITSILEFFIASSLIMIMYLKLHGKIKDWQFKFSKSLELLKDSWPIALSGVVIIIQANIEQVMLGNMIGDSEVGQYSSAMKLILAVSFLPVIIQSTVAPEIAQAKILDENLYYYKLKQIYRIMFLMFLIIALPLFIFSKYIILVLYGKQYLSAGLILSLLAFRLFFTNIGVAKSLFIINNNLFKYSLFTAAIGTFVNILLNYLLIPEYKSVGAIVSSIISFSFTIFIVDIFYSKTRKNLKVMFHAMFNIKEYKELFTNTFSRST